MKRPAVFIDRDGTINEQMGYVNHISRFVLLPGTAEGIRLLNRHQYLAIIVSNQSGVARGYFPMELIDRVHAHMKDLLAKEGANIDGIFFCPHYPRGNVPEYSVECDCRKPRTGLVQKACEEFDIDMKNSYVIGDRCSDIELAERSNLQGIMVTTGYGLGDIEYVLPNKPFKPLHIARDFLHAVRWIIEREEKS
ncbi:D,D-heptose 1,7-bisphosphate phosphatase [Candidatus Woesebacteria bacterium]|nr:MAG: D,D-heptose 1,7-bisphosphate phosphatase [Candidatus Woesebacteria bacterium]